jgi:hypothetical protein
VLETAGIPAVSRIEGRSGGAFCVKELVHSYAMWVSPAFNPKVIRTFDAVATRRMTASAEGALEAARLFPPLFKVARLIR